MRSIWIGLGIVAFAVIAVFGSEAGGAFIYFRF